MSSSTFSEMFDELVSATLFAALGRICSSHEATTLIRYPLTPLATSIENSWKRNERKVSRHDHS